MIEAAHHEKHWLIRKAVKKAELVDGCSHTTSPWLEESLWSMNTFWSRQTNSYPSKVAFLQEAKEFEVDKFIDVRCKDGECSIRIQWKGLDDVTWEPLDVIYADLPDAVLDFLRSKDSPRFRRALGLLQPHPPTREGGNDDCLIANKIEGELGPLLLSALSTMLSL